MLLLLRIIHDRQRRGHLLLQPPRHPLTDSGAETFAILKQFLTNQLMPKSTKAAKGPYTGCIAALSDQHHPPLEGKWQFWLYTL